MYQEELWNQMIAIMKEDIIPATGCTEPISVAYASAKAAEYLDGDPVEHIEGRVSANLMKNGMGVMVPNTGMPGLDIAAAAGAIGGNADKGLEVLNSLVPEQVIIAKKLIKENKVHITVNRDTTHVLYTEITLFSSHHQVKVIIVDSHTNIISIEKDKKIIFQQAEAGNDKYEQKIQFLRLLKITDILSFIEKVDIEKISFIKVAEELNASLAEEGLKNNYGLTIGKTLTANIQKGLIGNDLQNKTVIRTVAASDARMGGAPFPAMTNSGSGNQGIVATMPVVVVADYLKVSEEQRIRALALSNMLAIYIHSFLPKLSAFCATVTAAIGAATGMIWLLDEEHSLNRINKVICSMTGDVCGMICDGAANSCAMKVSSAVQSAFKSVVLALHDIRVSGNDGLVAQEAEECIRNIGLLATNGMQETDTEVLTIMLAKNKQ